MKVGRLGVPPGLEVPGERAGKPGVPAGPPAPATVRGGPGPAMMVVVGERGAGRGWQDTSPGNGLLRNALER